MFLEPNQTYEQPSQMNISTDSVLGKTVSFEIPRDFPLEEVRVHVGFIIGTAMTPTLLSATTPEQLDSLLGIVRNIQLTVNEPGILGGPKGPRTTVNTSGMGLIESAALNNGLDQSTQYLANLCSVQYPGGTATNPTVPVGAYQVTYRVPMVFPRIGEPLRSRCLLPVHLHTQNPVLTLSFASGATMMAGASYSSHITAIFVEIELIRRIPTNQSEAALAGSGGYVYWDLIESSYGVPLSSNAEIKFDLPLPGQYSSLVLRQYRGGTTVSRDVIDNSGIGNSVANGFGSETQWRLESASNVKRKFRFKHLRQINDITRILPGTNTLVTPSSGTATAYNAQSQPGGSLLPATNFRPSALTELEFLNSGIAADAGNELGSLLDCDTPNQNGRKMQLIGTPASVATNASNLLIVAHRFIGNPNGNNLSLYQRFA